MTDDTLPHETESLWMDTTPRTSFSPLAGDVSVDVAVVGGGIAGLTAADRLQDEGASVAVVEAGRVVEGVTGRTTAKVTAQHGLIYADLVDQFDEDRARQYARANQAAVETIAARVDEADVDCGFERKSSYAYVRSPEKRGRVEDEVAAARHLGLPASLVEDTPLPFDVEAAVKFDRQAQFHPRKYLLSLVEDIGGDGSYVFENTKATDVKGGETPRVETNRGTVTADAVVVATHFPIVDHGLYFARMRPKRSYVLAARLRGDPPEGMFYEPEDPYFSVRSYTLGGGVRRVTGGAGGDEPAGAPSPDEPDTPGGPDAPGEGGREADEDDRLVLFGGQDHKTGHEGDASERYRRLESHVRDRFDVASVEYRWSTQDYVSVDGVPYIGKLGPASKNVYVATGFGGWGMTNGTAAGIVLADQIRTGSHEWGDVFSPSRVSLSSVPDLLQENVHAGKEFVSGWMKQLTGSDVQALAPGEGTVVRDGSRPTGVYRGDDGRLRAVSAVCTHTDCIVEWNDAEASWDCPCHGSRFDPEGAVLDGPATDPLSAAAVPEALRDRE